MRFSSILALFTTIIAGGCHTTSSLIPSSIGNCDSLEPAVVVGSGGVHDGNRRFVFERSLQHIFLGMVSGPAFLTTTPMTTTIITAPEMAWATPTLNKDDYEIGDALAVIRQECQKGVMVTESAIPGAYQSICMTMEERDIPFQTSTITIRQGSSVGAGRTGVAVWNSCLLLTRLLERFGDVYIKNKTVLELGCGTGLASIACAKLGASRVVTTDGNPEVVELALSNAKRNDADGVIETAQLQWGLLEAMEYSDIADVVIGSDLTYNSGTWRVLTETISTVLKPGGIFLYLTLGHAGFNVKGELDGFLQVVGGEGMIVEQANLEQIITNDLSQQERLVLDATGGVRVLLLRKPQLRRRTTPPKVIASLQVLQ